MRPECDELKKEATSSILELVRKEGNRTVKRKVVEGIFYDGQIFDAYAQIISLIKQAKQSIILIDNYINVDTLTMLSNRSSDVTATIYTRQETLCLHQDARNPSSNSAERYIEKGVEGKSVRI